MRNSGWWMSCKSLTETISNFLKSDIVWYSIKNLWAKAPFFIAFIYPTLKSGVTIPARFSRRNPRLLTNPLCIRESLRSLENSRRGSNFIRCYYQVLGGCSGERVPAEIGVIFYVFESGIYKHNVHFVFPVFVQAC